MDALTCDQVREIDRRAVEECGVSSLVLMENAGRGCADVLCELGASGPAAIVCGKGNNGGDGFVIARHLDLRGKEVRVVLCAPAAELSNDAAANWKILSHTGVEKIEWPSDQQTDQEAAFFAQLDKALADADWVVDAILGTGVQGAPRPPLDDVVRRMNNCRAKKMAVDAPSGLNSDTGESADPTFRADYTCTFAAMKVGLLKDAAKPFVGNVRVCDIGAPRKLVEEIASGAGE